MKNFLSILLLIFPLCFFSQHKEERYVLSEYKYLLEYQVDSTDKSDIRRETFLLKRGKLESVFMSENAYKRDSLINNYSDKLDFNSLQMIMGKFPKTAFTYNILKRTGENKIIFYDKIITTPLKYEEVPNFNWYITGEKEIVNGLRCDIAMGKYAGRIYKAYFTSDIPVSDGPYKFHGLPGLIIKLEDSRGQYSFELLSYKNIEGNQEALLVSPSLAEGRIVSKVDFYRTIKNSNDNIINEISRMGFTISPEHQKSVINNRKKKNNPLELKP